MFECENCGKKNKKRVFGIPPDEEHGITKDDEDEEILWLCEKCFEQAMKRRIARGKVPVGH